MKTFKSKILTLGAAALLGTLLLSGCAASKQEKAAVDNSPDMEYANPKAGQKIYSKMFYKKCGISCGEMASKYTQDEWESFYTKNRINDAIGEYCSIMDELSKKEQKLIYDYMYTYARDTGHVAPCDF